jgi:3-carboxy-cis,cis-muconate cycloisomerase
MTLFGPLFAPDELRAAFSDQACLQGMLDFEAALARAEARVGVIARKATAAIAACCRAERLNAEAIARAAPNCGNLAIPLVKQLTALVARQDAEAARFVHWGATSQDAIDTGLVLQLRQALPLIEADLKRLSGALAGLAKRHRKTTQVGRTWLQQALPVTFGLKAAGWLDGVERHRERLAGIRERLLVVQFGGAAGTLAALGTKGFDVAEALARELNLGLPDVPWHGQRDRFAEAAAIFGLIVGSIGKMACDISLMMQTEIGEVLEPAGEGRGGSSTMPHKRNPVSCAAVLAAAARAPGLVATMLGAMAPEHERGLGVWQAEWVALPELALLAGGAVRAMAETVEGLEVNPARMAENLDRTKGLILAEAVQMALGSKIGRSVAHELIEKASRKAVAEGKTLGEVLAADKDVRRHLKREEIEHLLDPQHYLGQASAMVDRVLAARKK